ncbi:NADase-type glycan-binding domain-containing protein [Streptomyces sp. NPDC050504]|uniref:NADase-type glycan-binding domain-containing protein n=1 Tax=Streptomyces sp. NPDC050504 TaxID=3365618 RepID=UPI0037AAE2D5
MSDPQTRPCPECATPVRASGQSFCDTCGAFLRWDTPATPSASPQGGAAPQGTGAPHGQAPHGQAPRGGAPEATTTPLPTVQPPAQAAAQQAPRTPQAAPQQHAPQPQAPHQQAPQAAQAPQAPQAAAPQQAAPPAASPAPSPAVPPGMPSVTPAAPPAPPAPPARPAGPPQGPSDTVARSLLVPVPEATPSTPAAAPVLPARPDAARPAVRGPEQQAPVYGGTPCPACATPNTPGRHFCRACATPLQPRHLNTADGPYAGQRPRLGRDRRRWIARALIATAVVGLVVGGIFGGPPAARAVQDHFAKRVPVHPTDWKASHSDPRQTAKLAGDGYSNTWWGTGYRGDAPGQYLEAIFSEPTDLLQLLITPGSSKNTTQADGQSTPRTFDLVVKDSAGKVHTSHHRINDGGTQSVKLRVRDALSVRLVLQTAWRVDPNKQIAIAELEFFGRSAATS